MDGEGVDMRPTIVLLAPAGSYYAYVLSGLARAFNALGYPCAWRNSPVGLETLEPLLTRFDVAACLEINRVLPSGAPWPRNTAHLAWLQDYRFDGTDLTGDLGVSHHIYFLIHPSAFAIEPDSDCRWSVLLPGAREDVGPHDHVEMRRDFCLAGFIPAPLDETSPVSFGPNGEPVMLADFLTYLPPDVLRQSHFSLAKIRFGIDEACQKIGCSPVEDQTVIQVFDEILPRTIERKMILESIIELGCSLDIFGPQTWQLWPQFAEFYRGFVENPVDLDEIFQSTKINLHNSGLSMHHRVMDCLAAGGFLLVNETPLDFELGGIRNYLEPGRHYGSYAVDDIAAVAKRYLADSDARKKIAADGRREVVASHTWVRRAEQILRDLNLPVPPAQSSTLSGETSQAAARLQHALDELAG